MYSIIKFIFKNMITIYKKKKIEKFIFILVNLNFNICRC